MLNTQKGFSLIELIIFLSIFSVLILLCFKFLFIVQKKLYQDSQDLNKKIRIELAADILVRDLCSASNKEHQWDKNSFIFNRTFLNKDGEELCRSICYKTDKKGLLRIEGEYNFVARKWVKRSYSRMIKKNIKFDYRLICNNGFVQGIEFAIDDCKKTFFLRNGMVV